MVDSSRTLGLFGLVSLVAGACGPTLPQDTTSGDADSGGTGQDSDPTTTGVSTTSTDPTTSVTTGPPPECEQSSDCPDTYCGYCYEGVCMESPLCCNSVDGAPARRDVQPWRCQPFECDEYLPCPRGEQCEVNQCVPIPVLPPCEDPGAIVSQWQLGFTPSAFVLADLDADGDLDLAAAQPGVAQVEIALNDGAGDFTIAGAFGVGAPTTNLAIAAGDLDDDIDNGLDNDLAVLRGDANGGLILAFGQDAVFTPQPPLPTAGGPTAVFIRLLGEPFNEVITIGADGAAIRRAEDDFAVGATVPGAFDPAASLFDFNRDGKIDLLATFASGSTVGMWAGKGDLGFDEGVFLDSDIFPLATLAGDIDLTAVESQDDWPALVLARDVDGHAELSVWAGLGGPSFPGEPDVYASGSPIVGATMLETDAPQGPDILAATGQPGALLVLGDAEGRFVCERTLPSPGPTAQALLAAGDVNDDGRIDFVIGDPTSPTVMVLLTQ